ncbi:TB2/DP1, HVA22 family-domain-containing protein [Halteromyces radiatus]|uniref:TB2/DP1, HVA22 family-domain-containing protein n=1 Tax=Halteromyces radiatus TaxID=101107 RepID=UPI00221F118C|nr:TB2/DP1, HVA22 family-domain-containing protein [Halteromyces radiatus]KAI8082942.1 TB2/DP1, HVA22 family-domain-containing protein [Halteromyces radiatus]
MTIYLITKLFFLQLYPAYMCYKAIKVQDASQFRPLIIYWMVTSVYLVVEHITDIFLFWFPFYYEIKLLFIVWLILPQTNGTGVFYTQYMEPFLKVNEPLIDQTVIDVEQNVKTTLSTYGQKAIHLLRTFISDSLFKSTEGITEEPSFKPDKGNNNTANQESWSAYGIFSSLMSSSRVHQLTQGLQSTKTSTSATTPLAQQQDIQGTSSSTAASSSSTSSSDQDSGYSIERVDSYDSLASMVNGRRQRDVTSDTSSLANNNNNILPTSSVTVSTWSGYMASWIWKPQPQSKAEKQD